MIRFTIGTTMPTADEVMRRVKDRARVQLEADARELETLIKDAWVGWKYEGRPKSAPRGVSQAAWKVTLDDDLVMRFVNEARGYRSEKPYVAYVHRAGRPKAERAGAELLDNLRPDIIQRAQRALVAALREAMQPDTQREVRHG